MNEMQTKRKEKLIWVISAAILVLAEVVFRGDIIFVPMGKDSGAFAYFADLWLNGAILYKETLVDNKPPGIYFVDAAAISLFGKSVYAVQLIDIIWNFLSAVTIFLVSRELFNRYVAVVVSILFIIYSSIPALASSGNLTVSYMLFPSIGGIYLLVLYLRENIRRYLFWSGFLFGVSFLFKQPVVFESACALGATILLSENHRRYAEICRKVLLFAAGGLIPFFFLSLYCTVSGGFEDMVYALFILPMEMVSGGRNIFQRTDTLYSVINIFKSDLKHLSLLCIFSSAVVIVYLKRFNKVTIFLYIWFLGSLVGSLSGAIPSKQYYLQIIPSMAIIAGIGCYRLWEIKNKLFWTKYKMVVLSIALLVFLRHTVDAEVRDFRNNVLKHVNSPRPLTREETLANFVNANTNPGDYIYGFGGHTYLRVSFMANRLFATRHAISKMIDGSAYESGSLIYPHPSKTAWMMNEMIEDVIRAKPKLIFGYSDYYRTHPAYSRLVQWIDLNYKYMGPNDTVSLKDYLPVMVIK
ncbi:MAG: hypothetical protein HOG49_37780 [Candidatus Scalindua sp.]|jgi:hypothetical protein|nr:hypothetical protein [Candidatus Scalindua sp.]